nr:hypothetical protein [Methylobacterium sp. ZNC0032]
MSPAERLLGTLLGALIIGLILAGFLFPVFWLGGVPVSFGQTFAGTTVFGLVRLILKNGSTR